MDNACDTGKPAPLPEEEVLRLLCEAARPIERTERLRLEECHGRILAETLTAPMDVPPADNSAMDGYAVRAADCAKADARLWVSQHIPAGATGKALKPQAAARIFTGAPLPPGADAVVMQECCGTEGEDIIVAEPVRPGDNVRRRGEDIAKDSELLHQGTRLQPQHVGLAASVGLNRLKVYKRLRVAVFFTGDELTAPGNPLTPGKIYNSNRYVLTGLLQRLGCEVVDLGDVPDNVFATREVLDHARTTADVIITSGGVSVGEEDHVRNAVAALGKLELWNIAIKPGKPLAFGHVGETPFFGLPGNPVALFITCCLYARPFLQICQGRTYRPPRFMWLRAGFERPHPHSRREYLRARVESTTEQQDFVKLYPHQGSGVLNSLAWAEGLACIPEGSRIEKGDMVRYLPLEALFD
ncbi:MAG: molybdopterin molybdenumtransferase MoeA [Gammaproteobacteria bacterium]|nr:molybdopterin molybdenumtransferase MoeA [Gammaproteobacteria bacterium]